MRILLFLAGIFAFLIGCIELSVAETSIHQIGGLMLFIISAILISGAAIVEGTILIRKELAELNKLKKM
jgi:hypothetical protein